MSRDMSVCEILSQTVSRQALAFGNKEDQITQKEIQQYFCHFYADADAVYYIHSSVIDQMM